MRNKKNRDGFYARSDAGRSLFLLAREVENTFRKMENMLQVDTPSIQRFEKKMEAWKEIDALLSRMDEELREVLQKHRDI